MSKVTNLALSPARHRKRWRDLVQESLELPPGQTTSQARPLDRTSRLTHCWAKTTGWRWANVAMHPTPKCTFVVTVTRALSTATNCNKV